MERHHRKPKSLKGKTNKRNLSLVSKTQHSAWHALFDNKTPQEICKIIDDVWLDPSFRFICVARKRKYYDRRRL